jgi:hypothetical protein
MHALLVRPVDAICPVQMSFLSSYSPLDPRYYLQDKTRFSSNQYIIWQAPTHQSHPLYIGQWRTQEFYSGGGVQQIQFRTERTGIWGQWPPSQGFWRQL